jgi:hypothetical protein
MTKILFGIITLLLLTACEDKSIVNVYDKTILKSKIDCLKLAVFPQNKMIIQSMKSLYTFDDRCPYTLDISYKNGIRCNSTQNVQSKTINGFPSSYLNMNLRKGLSVKYSYYIDLREDVEKEDLEKGFERLKKDLMIK